MNQKNGLHDKDTPAGLKKQAAGHLAIAVLDASSSLQKES
jgi:hypothetical protein